MTEVPAGDRDVPRPFYDHGWPRAERPAARALWHWHLHLVHARSPDGADSDAFFEEEQERIREGAPVRLVPESVWQDAYRACDVHGLAKTLLAEQAGVAGRFQGSIRFATQAELDAFVRHWAISHGRLLAQLAGAAHSWQLRYVDEFSRGLFFLGRLMELPHDVERDWLFVPYDEREQAGVSEDLLRRGEVTEGVRRLLWKQSVRIRDAFAHAQPLASELERPYRGAFKRVWLGGLELIDRLERRDYDLWDEPLTLSRWQRVQVWIHAFLGRLAFRQR